MINITSKQMKEIISDLYLKDRTMVCDDYDYCLEYLKKYLDFTIHEYPSGETYWGWVVPDKYTVRHAYIKDIESDEIIVDVQNHPMHLASYSAAFDGLMNYNELKEHLFYNEDIPDAIPNYYKFQYRPWVSDWKFCITYNQFKELNKDGKYYVKVDTVFEKGTLKVAEYHKQGASDDTILLVGHLDHPGQVNDGLSGVVVELAVMLQLLNRETHYSYRFLIVQEFLGSVAYLCNCKDINTFKMGIFSEMLTTGIKLQLQKSFTGDTYIDNVSEMVFREELDTFDILNYLEGAGNDEIVFESPGIEVPFISILRARKDGKLYKQYHTHLDNIEMVDVDQLEESFELLNKLIEYIENDFYVTRKFDGFLCLSNPSIDLYFDAKDPSIKGMKLTEKQIEGLHGFQFGGFRLFDGQHRVSDIAKKYGVPFNLINKFVKTMEEKGLVALSHGLGENIG